MSMHIGVVNIEYIDQPAKAVCSFLQEAAYFLSGDRRTWSGAWESNAFLETDPPRLLAAARYYAREQGMSTDDRQAIYDWLNTALPWQDDVVMLHLDW